MRPISILKKPSENRAGGRDPARFAFLAVCLWGPMTLLRCPKFPRCLMADALNFDRGHSLTSLPLHFLSGRMPGTFLRILLLKYEQAEGQYEPTL